MSLIPYRIEIGFWWVGLLCCNGFTDSARDLSLAEFGFDGGREYNQCYPGATGKGNESRNLMAYAIEYQIATGTTSIKHMLYDADPINIKKNFKSYIKAGRIMLRDLYLEPYENDDPENLFIFPKVDEIKEVFCYNNVRVIDNFWFCTDWKG